MSDARKTKAELLAELRRLRAEQAAAAPAEHFRAVADYTYDLELWIGTDGRLCWVNPAAERLTGHSVAECLAMPDYPLPLVHADDRAAVAQVFAAALRGSSGNDVPFRLCCKDGGERWVAVSWQPIHSAAGAPLGYRASIRDISARRQAEDALRAQQALLDSIIALIPCGVYWKDRDLRYLGCNTEFARAAGVATPAAIVGKTDDELAWEPQQTAWFRACDRRVLTIGAALLNIEEPERQADGRVAILLTNKVPLRDAAGRVCGVLGVDTDISELKAAEGELRRARDELEARVAERTAALARANEQLRREIAERVQVAAALRLSEERYRLVAELTSDFAYAVRLSAGAGLTVEWVTDAFARITGRRAADLRTPADLLALVHLDDRPAVQRCAAQWLAGRAAEVEFRIVRGDGAVRWLRHHARPEWDATTGGVVRILGAAQDITDRKQAEEEARAHQATLAHMARVSTLGELTAQLAHELNQPLCTIIGNAQTAQRLLAAAPPDLAEGRAALADIVLHGNRAADIIRRLREFLRKQQPQPIVLNVQRVIEDMAALAEADARQHAARLTFDIAPQLPAVRGDPIQVQQVLLNLVRNGLEAMMGMPPGTRTLVVQARPAAGGGAVVSVSDRGPGLPDGVADRVFEPFYTTKPTGLGMGLAISRSIAEAYGGRLEMTSNPGRGMTFRLTLPPARAEPPP